MGNQEKTSSVDRLDSVLLRGKVLKAKEGESVTLEAQGALLTVNYKDIKEIRDVSGNEKEILVSSTAKIVCETLLHPREVEGILSREALVEFVDLTGRVGMLPNRCVECSRCTGGECECSRCNEAGFGMLPNRCVECSRCSGGECECSRCNEAGFGILPFSRGFRGGAFRRRLT